MRKYRAPNPARLRKLLSYDPETGILTWKVRKAPLLAPWNTRYAGRPAGGRCPDGYVTIKIDNQTHLAHRVIWAMVHGRWPECIRHRNDKLADNRLVNLIDTSRKAIQRNKTIYSTNTSGIRGVSWNRVTRKWVASLGVDGVHIYLGSFDSKDEAGQARRSAERRRDRLKL